MVDEMDASKFVEAVLAAVTPLEISDKTISGKVNLKGCRARSPVFVSHCTFADEVDMSHSAVQSLGLDGCTFLKSLDLSHSHFSGAVVARGIKVEEFSANDCEFGGDFDIGKLGETKSSIARLN